MNYFLYYNIQFICFLQQLEWIGVQFKDDGIFYMCPITPILKSKKIGTYKMIKWSDGFKYKAKLLKRGSKYTFL